MIYLIGALALITLVAMCGIVYALHESYRLNRQMADRLMARDLAEYTRCKPVLDNDAIPVVPRPEPKPRRRHEPQMEVLDVDVVAAQSALSELRGE